MLRIVPSLFKLITMAVASLVEAGYDGKMCVCTRAPPPTSWLYVHPPTTAANLAAPAH